MKVKNLILSILIFISTAIVGMGQITKPTNLLADPLNTGVTLQFTKPIVADTVSITKYQWKVVNDTVWYDVLVSVHNDYTVLISGLNTGKTYTVQLRGVDGIKSVFGDISNPIEFTTTTLTSPTLVSVVRFDMGLHITFNPPISNGGNGIQAYQYTLDGGFSWNTAVVDGTSFIVGGLTNGVEYTVGVRAVNQLGSGEHSNYIKGTPSTIPSQPQIVWVNPYNTFVEVDFYEPVSNGGAVIQRYQYSVDNGNTWLDRESGTIENPIVIRGLEMNTIYQVRLRAVNVAGFGLQSTATETKTWSLTEPINLEVTELDGSLSVSFDVPLVSNRSNIITYQYRLNNGDWVNGNTNQSPVVISGLENGTTYSVQLRAVNSGGFGLTSQTVIGVPFDENTVSDVQFINVSSPGSVRLVVNETTVLTDLEYKNGSSYLPVWANRPITLTAVRGGETILSWNGVLDLEKDYQFILQGDGVLKPVEWKITSDVRKSSTIPSSLQFRVHHTGKDLGTVDLQRVTTSTPRTVEQLMAFNIQYGGTSGFQSYGSPAITTFQITQNEVVFGQYLLDLSGTDGKVITFVFAGKVDSQSDRLTLLGFDSVGNSFIPAITTGNGTEEGLPTEFVLHGNYPNPFNPVTAVRFDLPNAMGIRLEVVDLLGRVVLTTPTQKFSAGEGRIISVDGSKLSSGVYFYRLIGDGDTPQIRTSKFTLLK
jgi:hypothetical protein